LREGGEKIRMREPKKKLQSVSRNAQKLPDSKIIEPEGFFLISNPTSRFCEFCLEKVTLNFTSTLDEHFLLEPMLLRREEMNVTERKLH
jgi:hypothetical protein